MGVKVNTVKDKKTLKEVTVIDCENGFDGDFICSTSGCNARMSFVPSHERRRLEKVIVVSSFFKLQSNEHHIEGLCPFNTKGVIRIIARDSDPDVLKSLSEDKYEFSLQVLHKPDFNARSNIDKDQSRPTKPSPVTKNKQYDLKGNATSYIKTLKQILTLRSRIDDNKELESIITLNYRAKKIKWKHFYFEEEQHLEAYMLLNKTNASHPVCIHGYISKIIPKTDKFKYSKLKLHSPYLELKEAITPMSNVELIIADERIDLNSIDPDQQILAYGTVKLSESDWIPPNEKSSSTPKLIHFLNINIWINHVEQIVIL